MPGSQIGLEAVLDVAEYLRDVERYKGAQEDMRNETDATAAATKKAGQGIGDFVDEAAANISLLTMGLAGAASGISTFVTGVNVLAYQGAKIEQIRSAFQGLSGDIEVMREGSHGMISDTGLMKMYNEAVTEVGSSLGSKLPEAMTHMRKIAAATDGDFASMVNGMISGINLLSQEQLYAMNINVDLQGAYAQVAAAQGITVDSMSRQQKQAIATNAVMKALRDTSAELPNVSDNSVAAYHRWQAAMQNISDELKTSLIPVLNESLPAVTDISDTLKELFESDTFKNGVRETAELLGDVLQVMVDMDPASQKMAAGLAGVLMLLPGLLKLAAVLKAITLAAGGVVGGAIGVSAGAGAAIAGAGAVGVAGGLMEIDLLKTQQAALQDLHNELKQGEMTYADYQAAMVAALQASPELASKVIELGLAYRETDMATLMLRMGLMESQELWQMEAMILASMPDHLHLLAQAYDDLNTTQGAARLSNADLLMSLRELEAEFMAQSEGLAQMDMMAQEALIRSNGEIQILQIEHEQAMLAIQGEGATARQEAQWEYNLAVLQAEQEFIAQRNGLLAAGRDEEAAMAEAQYERDKIMMENEHDVELQMLDRKNIMAQIAQQQAYIAQLNAQRDTILERLAMDVLSVKAETKNERDRQSMLLRIIGEGGSAQLRAKIETERQILALQKDSGKKQVKNAIVTVNAIVAAYKRNMKKALSDLDKLQSDLGDYKINLPKMPDMIFPELEVPEVKVPKVKTPKVAKEATKPAIEELENLMTRITNMIKTVADGLSALVSFRVPDRAKAGLKRLSEWIVFVVRELDRTYDEMVAAINDDRKQPERLRTMGDMSDDINRIIGVVKPTITAINLLRDELDVPTDMDRRINQFGATLEGIVLSLAHMYMRWNIFNKEEYIKGTSDLQLATAISEDVQTIMSTVILATEAMERMGTYKSGNLEELMLIFGRDFLMSMDFLGALAVASDAKVDDALLFRDNAQIIAEAINEGMDALQSLGGGMIQVDWGGFQAGLGLTAQQPHMGQPYPGGAGNYASNVYSVNISFPNLTIDSTDRVEDFGEVVGNVVNDMLRRR